MVSVELTPNLWVTWAKIALRQERRASEARQLASAAGGGGVYLGLETEESILGVVAVRQAFESLFYEWRHPLSINSKTELRLDLISTDLAYGIERWTEDALSVRADRNEVSHYEPKSGAPLPHPGASSQVSALNARFTVERCSEAVEFLMECVLRPALVHPTPTIEDWSSKHRHVVRLLDEQRATGQDLW